MHVTQIDLFLKGVAFFSSKCFLKVELHYYGVWTKGLFMDILKSRILNFVFVLKKKEIQTM